VSWLGASARDWRVWALWLFLQAPGFRVLAKFLPDPLRPAIPLWLAGVCVFYGALLHHDGVRAACRLIGRRRVILAPIVIVLSIVNAIAYPRVDGRKAHGLGSDEDDNLIQTSVRLVTGQRPVYVHTYLGNGPTQGPGWALMAAPLTLSRTYFLLTPLAYAALPVIVVAAGGAPLGAALAAILPLTSPAFWELMVTGSDLFAIGVLFVALTAGLFRWRRRVWPTALAVGLTVAAATSRLIFAFPAALVGSFLWARDRAAAASFAARGAVIVLIEFVAWWPDPTSATPIAVLGKGVFMLGPAGVAVGAVATVAATAVAASRAGPRVDSWMRSAWLVLGVMLGAIAVADIITFRFVFADWQAATYPCVAAPLLVAAVALSER
jgi:hypothetical protein